MKCPRCGRWNKDSLPHCFACGHPLNPRQAKRPDWRGTFERPQARKERIVFDDTADPVEDIAEAVDNSKQIPLAENMTNLKDRRARGKAYLQEFRQNAPDLESTASGRRVSVRKSDYAADAEEEALRPGRTRQTDYYNDDTQEDVYDTVPLPSQSTRAYALREDAGIPYEEDLPPMPGTPGPIVPPDKRQEKRVRGPMLIAFVLVGVLLVAVAIVLGYALTAEVLPKLRLSDTGGGGTGSKKTDVSGDYHIEAITVDGLPGHRILIPGEEGTQIYIGELLKSFVVVNGMATIEVADHVFYDTIEPLDMATMDVSLTPTKIKNSVETRMDSARYTISIPESRVELIRPEANEITINASIYSMELHVEPGSRVIINRQDKSDTVTDEGVLIYNAPVQARGNNHIAITVRAPYCRETAISVTLYRAPMEIPLELNAATLMNTSDEDLTINGTTEMGATIVVESPIFDEVNTSKLDITGEFTFKARMTRVGNNTIVIRASYPGKPDSILEHVVYYLPPESVYTKKAWALNSSDYSELMNNIALRIEKAQIYLCEGTIVEILSDNPQLVIMDTGKDGREQLVMLEHQARKTDKWILGREYRIYADVSGVYNNMPRLTGRYSYKLFDEAAEAEAEANGGTTTTGSGTTTNTETLTTATPILMLNGSGGDGE